MVYCGIDIGTTNTKAVILSEEGRFLGHITLEQATPKPQTADDWHSDFCEVLDYFDSRGFLKNERIMCSITAQGGTFVAVDGAFRPLCQAVSWTQFSSQQTVDDLTAGIGKNHYYHLTGWQPDSWLAACKLKEYLCRNKITAKARHILTVPDFVYAQLSGKIITDITSAQITGLCDFHRSDWSDEILDWVRIDRQLFPPISKRLKILYENAATRWGKISFATGSHDQYALMGAMDLAEDRGAILGTGTAWVLNGRSASAIFDDVNFVVHPGRDLYENRFGYIATMGRIGKGFDNLLNRLNIRFEDLGQWQSDFLNNDIPDFAIDADIHKGTVKPKAAPVDEIRRYMRYSASVVAFMLEQLEQNESPDKIVMTGGAAESRVWPQIIANVCDIPVQTVKLPELTAYGAARHAAEAAGRKQLACSLKDDVDICVYQPHQGDRYRKWYKTYQRPMLSKAMGLRLMKEKKI